MTKKRSTKWSELNITQPTLPLAVKNPPSIKSIEAVFRLEAFWRGTILARNELYYKVTKMHDETEAMHHHNSVDDLESLAIYARSGVNIIDTKEYQRWIKRWI